MAIKLEDAALQAFRQPLVNRHREFFISQAKWPVRETDHSPAPRASLSCPCDFLAGNLINCKGNFRIFKKDQRRKEERDEEYISVKVGKRIQKLK